MRLHDDLEVQLAHARDDHLAGLPRWSRLERRVLAHQLADDLAELVAVADFFGSSDIAITASGN
jgi:hypothetical protein